MMKNTKTIGMVAGLSILALGLLLPVPQGMNPQARNVALITLLMAVWWMTEAIPVYATAFLPMVLFPLLGVLPAGKTAINYGHDFVLMMISGFFLAMAIEAQNLHKRIALLIIRALGSSRPVLLLSMMLATAFLSMWIANVTAALLMLPIGMALIVKEESLSGNDSRFGTVMMLGIAFSASIGGTATLIGSPTNMIFTGILGHMFPQAPPVSFFTWLKIGLPLVIFFLPVIWLYLVRFYKVKDSIPGSRELIQQELQQMGSLTKGEFRVMVIFLFASMGWVFREDLVIDTFIMPGWASLAGLNHFVHDSTVGMAAAMLLFMTADGKGSRLLTWKTASKIPWGVGVIVGGGYALASGFKATELSAWIGGQLAFISGYPTFVVIFIVVAVVLLFTEINSNTATVNIFLPVLASLAVAGNINPLLLMLPATFASSFVFMMPAGTGPNTVIFGSNRITAPEMARAGLGLKVISMLLLPLLLYLLIGWVFGDARSLPFWAVIQ